MQNAYLYINLTVFISISLHGHFQGRPSFNTPTHEIVRMLAHIDLHNHSRSESEQLQMSVELEKPARPELGVQAEHLDSLLYLYFLCLLNDNTPF